ncbi:unnamed protein product [Clonostachys rosea f. rosea IK726]|uniref:Uncharacterized protein n=1 Tax=Clonostachys rosea f. rosea IK726 TaxID=1349383 RepID=A0ACA9TJ40_BIOOC|nr:unnamed protein product [Clonostachys rosea f. rosea IK726]
MGNHPSSEKSGRIPQKLPKSQVAGTEAKPNGANHASSSYLADPPRNPDLRSSKQAKPRLKDQPKPHGGRDDAPVDNVRRRSGIDQLPALPRPQDGAVNQQKIAGLGNNDTTDGSVSNTSNIPTVIRGQHRPPRNRSDKAYDRDTYEKLAGGHHPQGTSSTPISRTQSDASLYIPIRRRSTTETPGVATRLETPVKAAPAKKKDPRSSLPPAFSSFNFEEYANQMKRRLSTPSPSTGPENPILVETPSENEYKQLGVMKFGSLRIINGGPVSTPAGAVSNSSTSDDEHGDYFDQQHRGPRPGATNTKTETPSDVRREVPKASDLLTMAPGTTHTDEKSASSSNNLESHTNMATKRGQTTTGSRVNRSDSGVSLRLSPVRPDAQHSDSGYSSSLSLRSIFGSKKKREMEQRAAEKEKIEQTRTRREEPQSAPSGQQVAHGVRSNQTPSEKPALGTEQAPHGSVEEGHNSDANPQGITAAAVLSSKFPASRSRSSSTRSREAHTRTSIEEPVPRRSQELSRSTSRGRLRADSGNAVPHGHGKSQRGTQPNQAHPVPTTAPGKSPTRTRSNSSRSGENGTSKKMDEGPGLSKPTKLERLFGSRRRSLPDVHSTQFLKSPPPPMPTDAQEKLREHGSNVSRKSIDQKRTTEPGHKQSGASKPSHLSRAASMLVSKSKSRSPEKHRLSKQFEEDDGIDSESLIGFEAQVASLASIRKSAGNSAFDQAFVSMSIEYEGYARLERNGPSNNAHVPKHPKQQPRLRTRRSAPEFLETVRESGNFNDLDSSLESLQRAPPPVSLNTRGSKKKRRSKHHTSARSQTLAGESEPVPPLPPAPSKRQAGDKFDPHRQYLSHSLRTIPIASAEHHRHEENPKDARERSAPRHKSMPPHGFSRSGRSRPYFPKPGIDGPSHISGQCASDSSLSESSPGQPGDRRPDAPPYRVLHSYNSPSYRGVPIWSS